MVVVAVYVQGRKRNASDLMKVVHIKGPWEEQVTLLAWLGQRIVLLN